MRVVSLISIACMSIALVACGGDSTTTTGTTSATTGQDRAEKPDDGVEVIQDPQNISNVLIPPKIQVPPDPPPKELVVKELRTGTGAPARKGEEIGVQYVGVDYRSGKRFAFHWGPKHLYHYRVGSGEVPAFWEEGMTGTTVGARRELLVPASLTGGKGARLYVIDLIEVEAP
jgi:peptidylprolyl isomerase